MAVDTAWQSLHKPDWRSNYDTKTTVGVRWTDLLLLIIIISKFFVDNIKTCVASRLTVTISASETQFSYRLRSENSRSYNTLTIFWHPLFSVKAKPLRQGCSICRQHGVVFKSWTCMCCGQKVRSWVNINSELMVAFSLITDEELVQDYSLDRDLRDYHKRYWEREFKPVAEKLLDRIQSHHSFVPAVTITAF